jgi:predicted TIM-barrel fold metal-dependent hydrolase
MTLGQADIDQRLMIVSADCHAGPERVNDYEPYVPAQHADAFRDYVASVEAYDAAHDSAAGRGGALANGDGRGLWDMAIRQQHLDADGVAAEILFPQGSVPFAPYPAVGGASRMVWKSTPEQREVGPAIYNSWLADFCSSDPRIHYGVAVLPIDNVDAAVREVTRVRELGLHGGISVPPVRDDRHYNDPAYDRLWAVCQDLDVVLNIHGGAGMSYQGGAEVFALILSETDFFTRRALWYLIFSGVFERFPRLHLAMTEQRAHWVPPMLEELDSIYRSARNADLRACLPRLPSEYFATNCYIGASFMSKRECDLRYEIGLDRLMWGSDYPHTEGAWPWVSESLRSTFAAVDAVELARMVGRNAVECYHFDADRLRARASAIGPTLAQITNNPLPRPPAEAVLSWGFRQGPWD